MGQVLHGSATTTEAVRRAIQHSQASLRELARRYGVNPKTIAKWRKRTSVADLPTGPREPRSSTLSAEQEAIIVAFRRHTLLPLDDCLYALQATLPHLTRSALHRCLQRHGISRLRGRAAAARTPHGPAIRGPCAPAPRGSPRCWATAASARNPPTACGARPAPCCAGRPPFGQGRPPKRHRRKKSPSELRGTFASRLPRTGC